MRDGVTETGPGYVEWRAASQAYQPPDLGVAELSHGLASAAEGVPHPASSA